MALSKFPILPLAEWEATRNTLKSYAKILSLIRGALSPKQKHWWHDSPGIHPDIDESALLTNEPPAYNKEQVEQYWQVLCQIDLILQQFKAGLRQETSPVQFWADHFDLAVLWFSGRLVPGQDPDNAEYADEQMNFGFSTGDEVIPEPYFYITAYPLPDELAKIFLPQGASIGTAKVGRVQCFCTRPWSRQMPRIKSC